MKLKIMATETSLCIEKIVHKSTITHKDKNLLLNNNL